MSVERAAEYRRKARECLEHSHRAVTLDDKASWLQMAEGWQRLADNAEGRSSLLQVCGIKLPSEDSPLSN